MPAKLECNWEKVKEHLRDVLLEVSKEKPRMDELNRLIDVLVDGYLKGCEVKIT